MNYVVNGRNYITVSSSTVLWQLNQKVQTYTTRLPEYDYQTTWWHIPEDSHIHAQPWRTRNLAKIH